MFENIELREYELLFTCKNIISSTCDKIRFSSEAEHIHHTKVYDIKMFTQDNKWFS